MQLNDPLVAGGPVGLFDFFITPDSQTVIYKADQDVVGEKKLFAAALPGPTMGVPGDYNNDDKVDAADYVVWRKNDGTTNMLLNDPIGGTIGSAHYDQWRANFGMMAGAGAGATAGLPSRAAVPAPNCLVLVCLGFAGLSTIVRSR